MTASKSQLPPPPRFKKAPIIIITSPLSPQLQKAAHLDRAAEGDLAVALAEVHVAHAEVGALDEGRQPNAAAAREVFDVAFSVFFCEVDVGGEEGVISRSNAAAVA